MGVFKHHVFRAPNPYKNSLFVAPTILVPLQAGAPCTAAEGISVVLIGDRLVLEPSSYIEDTQTEVNHRHTTGEKGGLA
jgi:hypothetical protein